MLSRRLLERVEPWRGNTTRWEETNYKGTTPITKRLLQYWFYEEHFLEQDLVFDYWRCQREAIEALIYCYEVLGVRDVAELSRALGLSVYEQATLFEEFRHYTVARIQERELEIREAFAEYVACSSIDGHGPGHRLDVPEQLQPHFLNDLPQHHRPGPPGAGL
jgi:hypothetical protein